MLTQTYSTDWQNNSCTQDSSVQICLSIFPVLQSGKPFADIVYGHHRHRSEQSLFSSLASTLKIKPGFAWDKTITKAKGQSL
ncbi:MAG: hypothetical protein PHH43_00285 [Candidatus Cloacimonetes bacterium]|nr:hypothetical protein [Candidatus Cloacimonadota bacterium]